MGIRWYPSRLSALDAGHQAPIFDAMRVVLPHVGRNERGERLAIIWESELFNRTSLVSSCAAATDSRSTLLVPEGYHRGCVATAGFIHVSCYRPRYCAGLQARAACAKHMTQMMYMIRLKMHVTTTRCRAVHDDVADACHYDHEANVVGLRGFEYP